ncbi:MAG TPA: nucleotidyl transferase AbiEii/AbiGii toxin family protein, partial [Gammaproteobacteria bacterium]|nr:nucleotidyl transferase AbiEii/AbiGii toxin family protein [Gammaproteobacteria bacterium]HVE44770.1 nucleotidyl transferase AbiEii/AbiGii toxin family protein [Gammaproteobacteria bacterium]
MMINVQSTIEIFHLLFLQQLEKQMDKKLYALKGGCNLRFFFKSIRYSEDIDFDVTTISKTTLEKKVSKILSSVNFSRILQSN